MSSETTRTIPDGDENAQEMRRHYANGREEYRLARGGGLLELIRTQEIIGRYLPGHPATILDVGGGPGTYSLWLADLGHEVHLIDLVPMHVQQALRASAARPHPIASAEVGDARSLRSTDSSVDVVLLMGPLYHQKARSDRMIALREAWRVLRPNGVVCANALSRFSMYLDGLFRSLIDEPDFVSIMTRTLADGQLCNPGGAYDYFTQGCFHRPAELEDELQQAGFEVLEVVAVEGPAWLIPDLDKRMEDQRSRDKLLAALRCLERDRELLATSALMMAIGRRPPDDSSSRGTC